MSKNKIVEYVMNTPGNTNRAILSQMVDLETEGALEIAKWMDAETLVAAKQYTDSQRIAYVDGGSAIFDSTNPGELVHAAEYEYMYKFSPLYPSEEDLSRAKVFLNSQGMTIDLTLQKEGELNDNVTLYLFLEWDEAFLVVTDKAGSFDFGDGHLITLPTAGMYLFAGASVDSLINHFKLEFTWGTVKTIDPMFIPAMDYLTLNGADGKQYKVTVNESDVLTATAMEDT